MARYIALVLKCFAPEIDAAAPGTTFKEVSGKIVSALPFPLPPLAEQQRIVGKVDELMKLCDALEIESAHAVEDHQELVETCLGTLTNGLSSEEFADGYTRIEANFDALFATVESVDALKEAVLELAIRGRITARRPSGKPVHFELEDLVKSNAGVATSRHKSLLSKLKAPEPAFGLPEGWKWVRLGQLTNDLRYGTSKKCDRDESLTPVLRIPNVSGGNVNFDDMKFGPLEDKELRDLELRQDDLLIIRSNGSLEIVGRFAVVPELDRQYAFAGYLVRVRVDPKVIDPRYLWYVSNSRFVRSQIEGPIRHGVGLKNINSTEIASLLFPVPPLAEQQHIVGELDKIFEICQELSSSIAYSNEQKILLADILPARIK